MIPFAAAFRTDARAPWSRPFRVRPDVRISSGGGRDEFRLQFADAPHGRRGFPPLGGRQTRYEPSVDLFLTSPRVDRLIADAEVAGEIGDAPPGGEEIECPSTRLGWTATFSRDCAS